MKSQLNKVSLRLSWTIAVCALLPFQACREEESPGPSQANFAVNADTVSETEASGILVQIPFSAPAKGSGIVTVTFSSANASYGKDFTTNPAALGNSITLNILPNETSVSFIVLPVHNASVARNLEVSFSMSAASGAIRKGAGLIYSLTIVNVDQESLVNFSVNSGTVAENSAEGIVVDISLSAPAPGESSIIISFSASNVRDFTAVPAATGNTITLNVAANQTDASFKVLPVNNSDCSYPDKHINWQISFVNGSIQKGSNLVYALTLKDDEESSVVTFAESFGEVLENNASGIVVHLNLSKPASDNGMVYINYDYDYYSGNDPYGTIFTTIPEKGDSGIPLPILKGATSIEFIVLPVNNNVKNPSSSFEFYIGPSTGCLSGGIGSFKLTILDDD